MTRDASPSRTWLPHYILRCPGVERQVVLKTAIRPDSACRYPRRGSLSRPASHALRKAERERVPDQNLVCSASTMAGAARPMVHGPRLIVSTLTFTTNARMLSPSPAAGSSRRAPRAEQHGKFEWHMFRDADLNPVSTIGARSNPTNTTCAGWMRRTCSRN
jgi:hypothetical protein